MIRSLLALFMIAHSSAILADCDDPSDMDFFTYILCGEQEIHRKHDILESEIQTKNVILDGLRKDGESLTAKQELLRKKLDNLRRLNGTLELSLFELHAALDRYNAVVAETQSSIHERYSEQLALKHKLDSYIKSAEHFVAEADMSYDTYRGVRELIGLASEAHSYNKLRKKAEKAEGFLGKLKVVSTGLAKKYGGALIGKALSKFIPGYGIISTIADIGSLIFD